MRKTAIFMLILAVALGGVSVYLARDWLERQVPQNSVAQPAAPAIELTTVVVARRPLNFGDSLTKEYMKEVEWPAATLPEGSYQKIEDLFKTKEGKPIEKRVVLRAIQVNEPVLDGKITGADGRATLSTILEEDMRAVTIRVNDVNGVAGFVLPGDRVDILLTREEGKGNPITDVLLQHIKVLGIDQKASEKEDKPSVARAATFEVSQLDAQKLALAGTVGTLSLALRNEANNEEAYTRTVRISDLKGKTAKPVVIETVTTVTGEGTKAKKKVVKRVVTPAPSPYAKVTVVRGTDASSQNVLKDKTGSTTAAKAAATGAGQTTNSKTPKSVEEADEPATKGPKILVPQG